MIIEDGTGQGQKAGVSADNHLQVVSRTNPAEIEELFLGNTYNINTGTINLTAAGSSGLLYLKNTGDNDIVIPSFIWLLGTTNGTFGEWLTEIIRNPTTGTLISGASALTPVNRNFGSNNELTATCYKGAYGNTVTDGTVAIQTLFSSSGRYTVPVPVELPKGSSVALRVTPPAGNTDADVQVAMAVYEKTLEG